MNNDFTSLKKKRNKKQTPIIIRIIRSIITSIHYLIKKKKSKRFIRRIKYAVALLFFASLCIYINFKTHELKKEQQTYNDTLQDLDDDLEKENKRSESIKELKAYFQTKKYAEEVAREKFGLVYPNEIIFQAEGSNDKHTTAEKNTKNTKNTKKTKEKQSTSATNEIKDTSKNKTEKNNTSDDDFDDTSVDTNKESTED